MTATNRNSVHEKLAALSDPTRSRLLMALDQRELTVGELCQCLELPQSTVSRHLKILSDSGWVSFRSVGRSRWYGIAQGLDEPSTRIWEAVRSVLVNAPLWRHDQARIELVVSHYSMNTELL